MADSNNSSAFPLRPHIDRIAIIAPISDPAEAELIHSGIWTAFADAEVFTSGHKLAGYKVGKRIILPDLAHAKKRPLLNYHYTKGQGPNLASKLRIEFSPVDLSETAMEALRGIMVMLVPDGWEFFLKHGQVSMIEVTVDIPGVAMDHVHPMLNTAPSFRSWSSKGQLETAIFGKKKGNQYRIYDRGQKRKAKGQTWDGPKTLRVERILRNHKLPLKQLRHLSNPFTQLTLTILPACKPPEEPDENRWKMFCDSVAMRHLTGALKLLSANKRPKYRKWLEANNLDCWDPEAIWETWSDVLTDSKLL